MKKLFLVTKLILLFFVVVAVVNLGKSVQYLTTDQDNCKDVKDVSDNRSSFLSLPKNSGSQSDMAVANIVHTSALF